jgi:hypothetical protein
VRRLTVGPRIGIYRCAGSRRVHRLLQQAWGSPDLQAESVETPMTEPILQAALKPEAAERYPFLPVRMWTAATYIQGLVARHFRASNAGRADLPRTDFEFRWSGPMARWSVGAQVGWRRVVARAMQRVASSASD